MRLYQLPNDAGQPAQYFGTRDEAKIGLNNAAPDVQFRKDMVVHEVEVTTDKAGVLAALNGNPDLKIVRSFSGTVRGGLKEQGAADAADAEDAFSAD